MPKFFAKRLSALRCMTIALGVLLATAGAAALPAVSSANSSQIAIFQDDSDLVDPAAAFAQFRELRSQHRARDRPLVADRAKPRLEEEAELQRH